ncbi:hypothetical protein LOK49_LG10G02252 [Camellia lanceoleosa]|uniref:Uncharacterized protein n=1 Tax=Camellia lanceoleosa TaxID=1840588 RepID=A0ACC0GB16_9ERIC|nr:hypothetical protein LOK49_LG10G02252 [Camellia lanceoleosa]
MPRITDSSGPFWWVSLGDPDRALRGGFLFGGFLRPLSYPSHSPVSELRAFIKAHNLHETQIFAKIETVEDILVQREDIASHLIHYWGRHMKLLIQITASVSSQRRYLDHNQFTGRIPDAFYKHTFLKEMYVEGNAFRPDSLSSDNVE